MKIGIISEFNRKTINYGNNLQAYALNRYVSGMGDFEAVDTLCMARPFSYHVTAPFRCYSGYVARRARNLLRNLRHGCIHGKPAGLAEQVTGRLESFGDFQKAHMHVSRDDLTLDLLADADYDAYIVGSDIVWKQREYAVIRDRFLDFREGKEFKRISYAASFGDNWIPRCNEGYIRKCLARFDAISVREASAATLLESVGVSGAEHVLDPTMLISAEDWGELERRPVEAGASDAPYVFVYLLGTYESQRDAIAKWARAMSLPVYIVPNAIGAAEDPDRELGDVHVTDCAPEEWIWLIHHAEYVVTDSFHATVFSSIFEKRFFVMKREFEVDINVRMTDYLDMIGQSDKMVSEEELLSPRERAWDYENINKVLGVMRGKSKRFLGEALK